MILQKETFRTNRVHYNLVYTLPELRIFDGHKRDADAQILCGPRMSTIVRAVNAPRGNCHIHALLVSRIQHNGV